MEKIDLVLYILLGLFALNIGLAVMRTYVGWYRDADRLHAAIRRSMARGKFEDALQMCTESLPSRPHDHQLLWLEAECLFRLKRYEASREKFSYLSEFEPAWSDDAKKYLESIDSKT